MKALFSLRALAVSLFAFLLVLCAWKVVEDSQQPQGNEEAHSPHAPIHLFCAAGLRSPIQEIVQLYEETYHRKVHITYAGSGALEAQLRISPGDLFLPADSSYLDRMQTEGSIADISPFAQITPCLLISNQISTEIKSLADLGENNLRISIGDSSTAIGHVTEKALKELGLFELIQSKIVVTKPTVNSVAEDVVLGAVDVGIVWDAVARQFPQYPHNIPTHPHVP